MVRFILVRFFENVALIHNKKCLNVALPILHLTIETFQRHLQNPITFIHEISFVWGPLKTSCGIYSLLLRTF